MGGWHSGGLGSDGYIRLKVVAEVLDQANGVVAVAVGRVRFPLS